MSAIESTLTSFCQNLSQQCLVIAYSGGVDSQVLLHALAKLKNQQKILQTLHVCHINHGLSDNAKDWQTFAKHQCINHNLPFLCKKVDLDTQGTQSIEALARDARYQALQEYAPKNSVILTGHHLDDQSETFLLALKRGSGLKGLSAMQAMSDLGDHSLARPLLNISRGQIVSYAKDHKLDWIEDESNQDIRYDRNFLRHQIMPVLAQRWPSITQTIARSAAHCFEGQQLLNELAEQDLKQLNAEHMTKQPSLFANSLKTLSQARFNNVIRYYLSEQKALMPSTEQLSQLYLQLSSPSDKCPEVKVGDKWFRRFKKHWYLTGEFSDISEQTLCLSQNNSVLLSEIMLPDNLGRISVTPFTAEAINTPVDEKEMHFLKTHDIKAPLVHQRVTIGFSHQNPKCLPDYRQQRRPLKKVLQELNIPPWQRQRIPFLYYDNTLVAALGYFVCKEFIPEPLCDKLCIMWQLPH